MVSESEEPPEPPPEFDSRYREEFEGLLYLGKLNHRFSWAGHRFVIRTLTSGDITEIGLLHKPYRDTVGETKAYQALVVAACIETVDGKALPLPITNQAEDTMLVNRFEYVLRVWFPPTLDAVYEQYLILETKVEEALKAMGKVQG